MRAFGAKGDSIADDTHAFRAAISAKDALGGGIIHIPYGRYLISGVLNWTLGGITTIHTGIPFDAETGGNVGDGVHVQRPDILCKDPGTGKSAGQFAQVLNPSCFGKPAIDPTSGFFIGNLARNAYYSPATVNFDFNITKSTQLTERITHQLRAEFFNTLNNKNFVAPVNTLNNPNFGRILGAAAGRQIQLAMKLIF